MTTTTRTPSSAAPKIQAARGWPLLRLLGCLLGFAGGIAHGQEEATGTVTGRVFNAASEKYVANVRVQIDGTSLEALTDNFGEYAIRNVPVGNVTVRVSYSGQEEVTKAATVPAGDSAVVNFRFGAADDSVVLDAFVVETNRFRDAQEIAINAERVSVNIKSVVSTEAFGEIPSGNVGEFLKFLPGVELEYGNTYTAPTDAFGISVRGFGSADTAIYIDGVPVASAAQGSLTTQVGLDMLSINNASRIELIKVATPDMPMNSIGGQINLISKSAFEYAKPSLSWRAYVTVNSEHANPFEKVPGPKSKEVYAGSPGFELTYVHPVNNKLGFSVTASSFSQYSANRRLRPEWGTSSVTVDLRPFGGANNTVLTNANGPVNLANPYLTRVSITDAPRTSRNFSASLKGDWKPFDGLAISGSYTGSTYTSADAARRMQIRIQRPMTWDATSTISYPYLQPGQIIAGQPAFNPNSSLSMDVDSRDKEGATHTGSFRVTYQKGAWDVFALASASTSRASFKDFENGHLSKVELSANIGQIRFENIQNGVPGSTTIFDRFGNEFDFTQLANWGAPEIRGFSGLAESLDDVFNYRLDVRRELDFLPWDAVKFAVKFGYLREETVKKKWGPGTNYRETYTGPALTVADYFDTTYIGQQPGFGFAPQEWPSTYRIFDIREANPTSFVANQADQVENWNSLAGQNKRLKEISDAWYAMLDGSTFGGRLKFVGGLRQESKTRDGAGVQIDGKWNYVKYEDGTLYRNPALLGTTPALQTVRIDLPTSPLFATTATGTALRADLDAQGIAYPTAPVLPGTLAAQMLQRRLLTPIHGESKGDPSYSLSVAYDLTKNLVARISWSRTFGRIPIEDTTRGLLTAGTSFNINENTDPLAIPRGTITVANPNLLPEISNNWDYALTYYTESGGKFGASYYTKDVENFSDEFVTPSGTSEFDETLTSLGLDPAEYQDWRLTTSLNGIGTGNVKGYELEVAQDLRFLGEWGRQISVFGSHTHTHRKETNTTRISARPAASTLWTAGVNVSMKRISFNLRTTLRDLTFFQSQGNITYNGVAYQLATFDPARAITDATFNWQFAEKYSFYISGRDIFAAGSEKIRRSGGGIYPGYAQPDDFREFGTQITFGIKGKF